MKRVDGSVKEMGYKVKADNRGPADVVINQRLWRKTTRQVQSSLYRTGAREIITGPRLPFTLIGTVSALVAILGMSALQQEQTYDESIGTNREMLVNRMALVTDAACGG